MSLKLAFEKLGFGPCHHAHELFTRPHLLPLWEQAFEGAADWPAIFGQYRSTTDAPSCHFVRELIDFYPDAKVVLTLLDPEDWYRSMMATLLTGERRTRIERSPFGPFARKLDLLAPQMASGNKEEMIGFFRDHIERVKAIVPAERLLVYRTGEGWNRLCAFLDVPVPAADYPYVNAAARLGRPLTNFPARNQT